MEIPNYVEDLMYTCLNKSCRAPVIEYGHCSACEEIREDTIQTVRKYLLDIDVDILTPVTLPNTRPY